LPRAKAKSLALLVRLISHASSFVSPVNALRIATRQSALALWQAHHVAALLRAAHPQVAIELVPLSTRGDLILDRPLAAIGGKGLFLKELEVAMLDSRADIAVHSFKDVPMELEPEFAIGAVLERADAFDAFVSASAARLDDLPRGARVGTSSLRRQAQLRARRPDLAVLDLRGNVGTRLAKLDAGDYDAIILACAGLERLGEARRIRSRLEPPAWLPAAAQGAIAIEHRTGDARIAELQQPLHDVETARCVAAERALTRHLQGSCQVPIAAYCVATERGLHLSGLVGDAATGTLLRAEGEGTADAPGALGKTVAEKLIALGAGALLGH
jgi:hydroxymethylbilane synthase